MEELYLIQKVKCSCGARRIIGVDMYGHLHREAGPDVEDMTPEETARREVEEETGMHVRL